MTYLKLFYLSIHLSFLIFGNCLLLLIRCLFPSLLLLITFTVFLMQNLPPVQEQPQLFPAENFNVFTALLDFFSCFLVIFDFWIIENYLKQNLVRVMEGFYLQ